MVECPKCGTDVIAPMRTWAIPSRKPSKDGEQPKLAGIFECPECKTRFRAAIEPEKTEDRTANIKNTVERIRDIRGEMVLTLKNLREKIKTLETERSTLMVEIDKLRKVAESRATALESEVTMLREEVRSLRDVLGYQEPEQ